MAHEVTDGEVYTPYNPFRAVPKVEDAREELQKAAKIKVEEHKKFESGATSSKESLRYDLIPREGLDVLAARYTMGVKVHGPRNYRKGIADEKFITDRLNHIQDHLNKLRSPRKKDAEYDASHKEVIKAHLGAIMWGCCFLAEVLEHEDGSRILINNIIDF